MEKTDKIKVLVADSQTLFREGVCALLKTCENIEIVGQATNGKETVERAQELTPDVVLMDVDMSLLDGAEVVHQLRKGNDRPRVLLLTQYEDRERVLAGLKAGADGYLPKRATALDLASAITVVYQGGCFLYPSVAKTVVEEYLQHIKQPENDDPYEHLTYREKEVLRLMVEGHKTGEIANLLGIAMKTVLGHRTSIMRKLGIHSQVQLIKYAFRRGIINIEVSTG